MSEKKIIIIGAAGFVGVELVDQLQNIEGYELYALTKDNGGFILQEKKIQVLNEKDIEKIGEFDVVINLAYPTSGLPKTHTGSNLAILNNIKKLTGAKTKVIQVSTQAIFGFGMDKPISTDFRPFHRDYPYIEAKLLMEHMVRDAFPQNDLAIVRLGNVWGAASGTWTGSIASKLLFGQYISVDGVDGYANITDVKNAASYISHLIENMPSGKNIYHVAEFSHYKWSQIIDRMAKELNVDPVYSDAYPEYIFSLKAEYKKLFKIPSLRATYTKLNSSRFLASYVRSILRTVGKKGIDKIKGSEKIPAVIKARLTRDDATFLTIMSSPVQFEQHVLSSWIPLLNFEQSWQSIRAWMQEAGYIQ